MKRRKMGGVRSRVRAHTGRAPMAAKIWVNGSPVLVTVWTLRAWRDLPYELRPKQACWSWDGRVIIAAEEIRGESPEP